MPRHTIKERRKRGSSHNSDHRSSHKPRVGVFMRNSPAANVSPEKAKKILRDGSIRGKPLTKLQRGLFGLIAGGGTPRKKSN